MDFHSSTRNVIGFLVCLEDGRNENHKFNLGEGKPQMVVGAKLNSRTPFIVGLTRSILEFKIKEI